MVIIIKWGKIKTESKATDDDASDSWKGGFHMSGKKQIGLGIAALAAGAGSVRPRADPGTGRPPVVAGQ